MLCVPSKELLGLLQLISFLVDLRSPFFDSNQRVGERSEAQMDNDEENHHVMIMTPFSCPFFEVGFFLKGNGIKVTIYFRGRPERHHLGEREFHQQRLSEAERRAREAEQEEARPQRLI